MDVVELTLDHSEASKEPEDLVKEARHQASVWRPQEWFFGSTPRLRILWAKCRGENTSPGQALSGQKLRYPRSFN